MKERESEVSSEKRKRGREVGLGKGEREILGSWERLITKKTEEEERRETKGKPREDLLSYRNSSGCHTDKIFSVYSKLKF